MRRTISIAMLSALLLLVSGYYFDRIAWFDGLDLWQLYIANTFKSSYDYDDAVFVNVGNDKEIIPYFSDPDNAVIGNQTINDRQKLYQLLSVLDQTKGYRYIILDLLFDKDDVTPVDSALYSLISRMDNIVVGRNPRPSKLVTTIEDKSAHVYYYNSMNSSEFTRCIFINSKGDKFLPLKAYEELNPDKKFNTHGFGLLKWYTSGGRLCNNGAFVDFDMKEFNRYDDTETVSAQSYYNLTYDLLENPDFSTEAQKRQHIASLAQDKYVVIGDFVNDTHDTFVGKRPGPLINYRAFKTLSEGKHQSSLLSIVFWFVIYTVTFLLILPISPLPQIEHLKANRAVIVLSSFISISLIFLALSLIEYLLTSRLHNITYPLFVFGVTKCVIDVINSLKTSNPAKK